MASHQKAPVPLTEKLVRLGLFLVTVVQAILSIPATLSAVQDAEWPFKRVLAVCFLRHRAKLVKRPSNLDKSPTTGELIRAACEKRNIKVSSNRLQCEKCPDASLHEIELEGGQGDTLLYFHGGGYRNCIVGEGHVPVVLDCAAAARASKVIFLEYCMAPGLMYPGQLVQAARALEVLLSERKIQPSQLIIGGDSAGGNLVLALLAHLHNPKPGVPAVSSFKKGGQFKAVFLISPWVTLPMTASSFRSNSDRDYLNAEAMAVFNDFWQPSADAWADLLLAEPDFWATLPVQRMIATVGSFEVFRDDVITMAERCGAGIGDRLTFAVVPGEVHVQAVVDVALGLPPAKSLIAHLEFMRAL